MVHALAPVASEPLRSVDAGIREENALTDVLLSDGCTVDLGPLRFAWPMGSFSDFLRAGGPSVAGHSAVSGWLSCPEASRLRALGIHRKPYSGNDGELDALAFGNLAHVLSAVRPVYGEPAVYQLLNQWRGEIDSESLMKAELLFKTYDTLYPLIADPFEYLGVESEVRTNIGSRGGAACIRTVRYDAVVRLRNPDGSRGAIFSLEKKTMSRSGASALNAYTAQAMIQQGLWNANAVLVEKYGSMAGVVFDCLVKTITPTAERVGPKIYSNRQQNMALDYLRLPDDGGVIYAQNEDGTYPKFLHACWGRWRPCEYIGLCHEEANGDYEDRGGNTYEGPERVA